MLPTDKDQAPDLTAPLPVLRVLNLSTRRYQQQCAVLRTNPQTPWSAWCAVPKDDTPVLTSTVTAHEWVDGRMVAECDVYQHQIVRGLGEPLTEGYGKHAAPAPGCTCGVYGWLPFSESRWWDVTPLSVDADDVDPRPHPLLVELTSWGAGRSRMIGQWPGALAPVVVAVEGTTFVHQAGVRAERGQVVAMIDPRTLPVRDVRGYPAWLDYRELDAETWGRFLDQWYLELARPGFPYPFVSWDEARDDANAQWSALRERLNLNEVSYIA